MLFIVGHFCAVSWERPTPYFITNNKQLKLKVNRSIICVYLRVEIVAFSFVMLSRLRHLFANYCNMNIIRTNNKKFPLQNNHESSTLSLNPFKYFIFIIVETRVESTVDTHKRMDVSPTQSAVVTSQRCRI